MCEKYELGLTRNRLFDPCSLVLFRGKYRKKFDEDNSRKAFKMLLEKEPVLSTVAELQDDGRVFLIFQKDSQKLIFSGNSAEEIISSYNNCGLDFSEKLFEFTISGDELIIASHTAVADGKSLLRLAKYFISFYEKKSLSIEPSETNVFSDFSQLPVDIASPLTDKLASDLDEKWNKKTVRCDLNDYKKARFEYSVSGEKVKEISATIPADDITGVKEYCSQEKIDLSSVVAFAFYKTLSGKINGDKKFEKMVVSSDRRFFFENSHKYSVGAFDGSVEVSLGKKDKEKALDEQLKNFHLNLYKSITSVFKSFYDDVLLMKISPMFCHSAYMYALGFNKNKASKRLAENYSCLSQKMCRYSSYNLEQEYWKDLESFSCVSIWDSMRMSNMTLVSFVLKDGEGTVSFRYKSGKISENQAQQIVDESLKLLANFKK